MLHGVAEAVGVPGTGVNVKVAPGTRVAVDVEVDVAVEVAVTLDVDVEVAVDVDVAVLVAVEVAVAVAVDVEVAVGEGAPTGAQFENSEVFPSGSVAVAVRNCPTLTGGRSLKEKLASPLPSVVTFLVPRNIWPSPYPYPSHALLAKNWTRKVVFGVEFRVPCTAVKPLVKAPIAVSIG
jgi:hypothetical protein